MLPREVTIKNEEMLLSPYACKSEDTKGRERFEEPCPIRTDFQRDRDRIIHCNSFRRLKHKTQVFLIPKSDHYRTRLTHTLEVAQISRTVARALRLNEDLTEAIALGHDLGHTPFGHDGERTLNRLFSAGFTHYQQSVRVVEVIERDGNGLNLTQEVRNGIYCHTNKTADTLEGVVVKYCDRIAYINHDIEDSIRGGLLTEYDLPGDVTEILGHSKSERITTLVSSIIEESNEKPEIKYPTAIEQAFNVLTDYMYKNVYYGAETNQEKGKACIITEFLYKHYCENPGKMPPLYQHLADIYGVEMAVCDFISGMSDDYAVDIFKDITIPKSWNRV